MTGTDPDLPPAADFGSRLVRHAAVLDATAAASVRLHRVVRMLDATAAHIAPRLDAVAGVIVRRICPEATGERGRTQAASCRTARAPLALYPPARPE